MVYLMNYFFLPTYRWLWFWVIFFRCFSWTFENESEMNHLCNWGWDNHCTLLIRLLFVAKVNGGSLFPPIFQSLLLVTCLCIWIRIFCFFWALRWYCFLLQAFFFGKFLALILLVIIYSCTLNARIFLLGSMSNAMPFVYPLSRDSWIYPFSSSSATCIRFHYYILFKIILFVTFLNDMSLFIITFNVIFCLSLFIYLLILFIPST